MGTTNLPRLSFQRQSPLGEDYWHSVVISLLRGLAALLVAAAHLRADIYPGLRTLTDPSVWYKVFAFVAGFGHQAVLVFFVISGWLVGGSLLNKMGQPGAVANYAIDRVTRLWTVLAPAFVLTLLIGLGTGVLLPGAIDFSLANEFSALSFVGNLLGLQRVALKDFGGNYALWSLANETWYYVMFPLLVVLATARRGSARIASAAALALAAAVLPIGIIMYFGIWLLGVAFSRVRIDCSTGARCVWLVLLAATLVYSRLTGSNDEFSMDTLGMDLLCSLMLLVLLSSLQFRAAPESKVVRPVARVSTFFADFSFSLYVLHVPLIVLMKHVSTRFGLSELSPAEPLHFAIYLGMLAAMVGASYVFYLLFESHTYRIRRLVKDVFVPHAARQGAPGAVPAER